MAVTYMCGFESASAPVEGFTITGTAAYSTTQARTGSRSIRCNPASSAAGYIGGISGTGPYLNFALYVATLPSVDRTINGTESAGVLNVRLTPAGALAVYTSTTLIGTSSAAFASPGWHWVAVRGTSGTGVTFLQIDGADEVTGTATITGYALEFGGISSAEASAFDIYIDDLIIDDTGLLAPSKVGLLLPISDNARATLWTGGSGGTTNLWDAVDNVPPAGLATESNTSQIEHAGGAAGTTDAYDANMTTYTTAGVGGSDTVLAVQGLTVWGEDSATGAKLLSYSGVSNPSWTGESSIDVSTGDGSGATLNYRSATPDFWNERRSAILTSPSVTVGTSPVMRVVRPETASRVASVCFMGMVVAWTPAAVVARVPFTSPYPQLLAH